MEVKFSDVDGWMASPEFNNARSSQEQVLPIRSLPTFTEQAGITLITLDNMLVVSLDQWSSTGLVLSRMILVSSAIHKTIKANQFQIPDQSY